QHQASGAWSCRLSAASVMTNAGAFCPRGLPSYVSGSTPLGSTWSIVPPEAVKVSRLPLPVRIVRLEAERVGRRACGGAIAVSESSLPELVGGASHRWQRCE